MDDNCEIKYEFDEPQDIVRLDVQFYKGDERSRTLKITSNDGFRQIVESSGHSQGFEEFDVDTRGSSWLTLEGLGMDGDEWLSITEVGYWCLRFRFGQTAYACTWYVVCMCPPSHLLSLTHTNPYTHVAKCLSYPQKSSANILAIQMDQTHLDEFY